MKRSNNIAARMGRWSASHRKIAIFGWLAFVIAAFVIGAAVGTKNIDPDSTIPGESGRAEQILRDEFPQAPAEEVLVQSKTLTTKDAEFRATIDDVVARISKLPVVRNVESPLDPDHAQMVSRDGRSAIVHFELTGERKDAENIVEPVEAAVAAAAAAHPQVFVGEFGDGSSNRELNEVFNKDLAKAGELSLPVTLAILVLAFGAIVAAGLPLLLALSAVFATMGLLALPSQLMPVDENIFAVILLIGLAVGVDYAMFYIKREREERAAGRSEAAALEAAAATSGRSVLISGITVMVSMAGMFLTGDPTFSSFALGTILVVAIAVLGSLTVLPALLSKLGDRVDKGRIPFLHRLRRNGAEGGAWSWILERVLRRPLVSAIAATAVLLALAAPAIGMKTVTPGPEALPQDLNAVQIYNRIQSAFPGEANPARVVLKGNVTSPETQAAIADLKRKAVASGVMYEPIDVSVSHSGDATVVDIPLAGKGSDDVSNGAVATLRDEILPATVGSLDDVEVAVTGGTAQSIDWNEQMRSSAPWVFAFVLVFAFGLLLVSFRSVVIAAKAVVLNLLSVAAAFGVLTLVFQHGWGKDLLGFDYTGGVMAFLPVFMFVILFGLSMDYHVFILSRVREAYDRGMRTEDAVAHGIKSTAGVVTSAAIVMVFVFSIFGTLSIIMLKQFGVGLAVAVLIDATIVRAVLLPAAMKLLGDWNWYLPRWLEWLPQLEHERAPDAPALPVAA
ncbi:MAG TPA: MMPL family transporter [Gaiellaceae bacterium]|nr:MMPL family transporter [Gaiellaceae bacterium]